MKKLLGILVLGLLWCNVGFANPCDDWSWKINKLGNFANFTIENKSDYVAKITGASILTKNGAKTMHTEKFIWPIYVKPFNKKEFKVTNSELLWELAGKARISCTSLTFGMYELETKPKERKKKKKSGAKKLLEKIFDN